VLIIYPFTVFMSVNIFSTPVTSLLKNRNVPEHNLIGTRNQPRDAA